MSSVGAEDPSIETRLRGFIAENFLFALAGATLGADDSFIGKGFLDSTGVLELVTFVERSFGISISDEELVPENMDSISGLVRYIRAKSANGSGATA